MAARHKGGGITVVKEEAAPPCPLRAVTGPLSDPTHHELLLKSASLSAASVRW